MFESFRCLSVLKRRPPKRFIRREDLSSEGFLQVQGGITREQLEEGNRRVARALEWLTNHPGVEGMFPAVDDPLTPVEELFGFSLEEARRLRIGDQTRRARLLAP